MAMRKPTPEEEARWQAERVAAAEAKQRLLASIERLEAKLRGEQERYERRRRRLRRLTFGLLA
jgi:hypothetical protein